MMLAELENILSNLGNITILLKARHDELMSPVSSIFHIESILSNLGIYSYFIGPFFISSFNYNEVEVVWER